MSKSERARHPVQYRRKPAPAPGPAAGDGPARIEGYVEHIVFRSDQTGYTVCHVRPGGRGEKAVVVGNCAAVWVGQTLQAEGKWTRHPEYGFQFSADRIVCVEPHSIEGITRYLAGGIIKGIGPMLAERLVRRFGKDTLRIIEKESAALLSVPGIGAKRRDQIREAWKEQKAVQEIMLFLHTHGVTASQASRVYKQYGDDAIALIKANPYRLADEIWGIGFKTADKIANSMGIEKDSPVRARAGIVYTLQTISDEGHCFSPRQELVDQGSELLGIGQERLAGALDAAVAQGMLTVEGGNVYLTSLYYAETGLAQRLGAMLGLGPSGIVQLPEKAVRWAEAQMKITFAQRQAQALETALRNRVSVITGGPGVGKTTIIRALVEIFKVKRRRVVLAAPTGRAAKRMAEATGHEAGTIHRLLKYQPGGREFVHGPSFPLDGHVFILDEVSMIDVALMNAFVRALPRHAELIMVGDADQLPSVGPGNVLRDILNSGAVPFVQLDTIFRQGERSWIVHNAHRINNGMPVELPDTSGSLSDFYFVPVTTPEAAMDAAINLVARRIPLKFGLNPMRDVQVLTPMRRFQLGADNLNDLLQKTLNPAAAGESLSRMGRSFAPGDRVMQMKNNYDKDVFNGDIGFVKSVDQENQSLVVEFDDKDVEYGVADMDELILAYACSIHKSQGNEHPAVVIIMTMQHYKMLRRNLLYTALTRGRKLVCLLGDEKAIKIAVHRNDAVARRTGLAKRLAALCSNL